MGKFFFKQYSVPTKKLHKYCTGFCTENTCVQIRRFSDTDLPTVKNYQSFCEFNTWNLNIQLSLFLEVHRMSETHYPGKLIIPFWRLHT